MKSFACAAVVLCGVAPAVLASPQLARTAITDPEALAEIAPASPAVTNPDQADQPGRLSGDASLGLLSTSGNTDTRSANGKLQLSYVVGPWTQEGKAAAVSAQQDNLTTDERYSLGYKLSRDFDAHNYVFLTLDYDNDRFAGIAERTTQALGYGRRLLTLPAHSLDAEIGLGATQIKLAEPAGRENSAVALLNAKYVWEISATSKFSQGLKVERSRTTTYVNPVSELKLTVAGNLFASLGYELRYNSDVPDGTRKTDTLTSVNLGYGFGEKK